MWYVVPSTKSSPTIGNCAASQTGLFLISLIINKSRDSLDGKVRGILDLPIILAVFLHLWQPQKNSGNQNYE